MTEPMQISRPERRPFTSGFSAPARAFGPVLMLVLFSVLCATRVFGAGAEEQYVDIIALVQEGDALQQDGKLKEAIAKFRKAYTQLDALKNENPAWNRQVVAFRLNYLVERITALNNQLLAPPPAPKPAAKGPDSAGPAGSEKTSEANVQVKVLEPGNEPRVPLRLQPKEGDKQTCVITTKTSMDMKMGAMDGQAVKMPSTRMTLNVTVTSISAEDIGYDVVVENAEALPVEGSMPQVLQVLKPVMEKLKGVTGKGVISTRGFAREASFEPPANADPQVRQAVKQLTDLFSFVGAGFPEEPVGPGAKWEVQSPVKTQGMTIQTTSKFELLSLENERLSASSTVSMQAANQKFENPSMPGMLLDLMKMTGQGTSKMSQNLNQVLPSEVNSQTKSEFSLNVDMGGQKQPMTMKVDSEIHLESK